MTKHLLFGISGEFMERMTRFELATLALARRCSTTEPHPHKQLIKIFDLYKINKFNGDLDGIRTHDLRRDRAAF